MTLEKSDGMKIILTLGDIIHRQRGLIGQDTCVVLARSSAWPGRELVVKISWPGIHRDSEKKLMDAAKAKADEMAGKDKRHWVLDHLPEILHSQDFRFNDKDSPQRRLMELLIEAAYADGKAFIYEERLLRITVSERLFPITDLTNVKDVAQVFLDILQCHRWLFDHAKILHRDISMANVMYRKRPKDDKVCGVLNDFDLSSFFPLMEATSLRRTGTPPDMAHDLLDQSDIGHLYRHDVEALYYVLLMLCCRYEIVEIKQQPTLRPLQLKPADMPFAEWFDRTMTWGTLSDKKAKFLAASEKSKPIPISPSFSAFLRCLRLVRRAFAKGISARIQSQPDDDEPIPDVPAKYAPRVFEPLPDIPMEPFDDETLGGHITYFKFVRFVSVISIDGQELELQYEEWQQPVP
ncbi:hypothetical protein DFS33DRAFT_1364371 [Desarmillaria ectypa]|nr:hypothetical protein DFS33DRAFT_1364371 [Desarmillaria ectypa]